MGKFSLLAALGVLALLAVTRAMPQPDSDSSFEKSDEIREIMEEFPKSYESTEDTREMSRHDSDSDEAYAVLTEAIKTALVCAKTTVDLENIMSDFDTLSNETRTTFFTKYCPQLKNAGSCLDDLLEAIRPNLKENVFTIVKAMADNYPDAVELSCKNDGEMIFKLVEPKTKECVKQFWDEVMEFVFPIFFFATYDLDIAHLKQSQCETLSELRQYVEVNLNVCNALDLMSVYDLFHNTLFSVTTCRNYVSKVTEIEDNTANEK